jgi:hypothetical protein
MMLFLSFDVVTNLSDHGFADGKCAVPFLPREAATFFECPRNPTGRIRFHFTDQFRERLVLAQFREHMDVVRSSVYDQRDSAFAADCAAEVFVNPRSNRGNHPRFAVLRGKHNVIQEIAIGGTHNTGPFRRPFSGAKSSFHHTSGSFATLHCPCSSAALHCRLYSAPPMALDLIAGHSIQRRRRDGLKPRVKRSGTRGIAYPHYRNPW